MRMSWLEGVCVLAIAIAALQVTVRDREARLFDPPTLPATVLAKNSLTASPAPDVRSHRPSQSTVNR